MDTLIEIKIWKFFENYNSIKILLQKDSNKYTNSNIEKIEFDIFAEIDYYKEKIDISQNPQQVIQLLNIIYDKIIKLDSYTNNKLTFQKQSKIIPLKEQIEGLIISLKFRTQ